MPKIPDTSRREFLSNSGKLVMGEALLTLATTPVDGLPRNRRPVRRMPWRNPSLKLVNSTLAPTFTRNCRPARSGTRCWTTSSGRR